MCGIVGYVGAMEASSRPQDVVMGGLSRLEYRGYHSAGIAGAKGNDVDQPRNLAKSATVE